MVLLLICENEPSHISFQALGCGQYTVKIYYNLENVLFFLSKQCFTPVYYDNNMHARLIKQIKANG